MVSSFGRRLQALRRAQSMRRNKKVLLLKRKRIQNQRDKRGVSYKDALALAIKLIKRKMKLKLAHGREWYSVDDTTYQRYMRWLAGPGPLRSARKLIGIYKAKYGTGKKHHQQNVPATLQM